MKLRTRIAMTVGTLLLSSSVALADCPGTCPTLPAQATSGTATNNTTNNVQGVSNPSGVLVNQQNNFTTQGQVQYGNGVACQDNSINPYFGKSDSSAAGFGNYQTTTFGIAATILIGPNHGACQRLAQVMLAQHQNDTTWGNLSQCVKAHDAHVALDSAMLHGMCQGIAFDPQPLAAIPVPVIQTVAYAPPAAVVAPARPHLSDFSPRCDSSNLGVDLAAIHEHRHAFLNSLATHHPDPSLTRLEDRVLNECGTMQMINSGQGLDG